MHLIVGYIGGGVSLQKQASHLEVGHSARRVPPLSLVSGTSKSSCDPPLSDAEEAQGPYQSSDLEICVLSL